MIAPADMMDLNLLYRNWQATGQLWEKYNIVKGNIDVVRDRYTVCNHLGWTAGVFAALWHGEMTGGDR